MNSVVEPNLRPWKEEMKKKKKNAERPTWKCSKKAGQMMLQGRLVMKKTTQKRQWLAHNDVSYRNEKDS